MAIRVYLIPIITDGASRGPAYFPWRGHRGALALVGAHPTLLPFGLEDWALATVDVSELQHAFLAAQADVVAFPDLDAPVDKLTSALATRLENVKLPAEALTGATTCRALLRRLSALALVSQAVTGMTRAKLTANLDTPFEALPTAQGIALLASINHLKLDRSQVRAGVTVRTILTHAATQWTAPVHIGNLEV